LEQCSYIATVNFIAEELYRKGWGTCGLEEIHKEKAGRDPYEEESWDPYEEESWDPRAQLNRLRKSRVGKDTKKAGGARRILGW
jgi:hypothetical protein